MADESKESYAVETLNNAKKYKNEGKIDDAITNYNRAIDIFKELGDDINLASSHYDLGNLYFLQKQHDIAIDNFNKSYVIFKKTDDLENCARVKSVIGTSYLELGDKDLSRLNFMEAGKIYQTVAERFFRLQFFPLAQQYFTLSADIYNLTNEKEISQLARENAINAELSYFEDLCKVANFFNYSRNSEDTQSYAWRALAYSMDIMVNVVKYGLDIKSFGGVIKGYFDLCKRALLSETTEFTPVISLKLDELYKFYQEITDEIPDDPKDVNTWIQTHIESLRFLMPQIPPSFYILTPDGRFLCHMGTNTLDNEGDDTIQNHLMAGLLTATCTMFLETSVFGSGPVKEIILADKTLVMETRAHFVVIAIVTFAFDEIRNYTSSIANELEEKFADIIEVWKGNKADLDPIIKLLKSKIQNI